MMQIILCRHGETAWSLSGKHTSFTDIPLTKKGEAQASELGKKLENFSFDAIYTSPLIRAQNTCLLAHLPMPPILEPNAVEWNYGIYEGLTTPEIHQKNPGWNLFFEGAPEGETSDQVKSRADLLIEKWEAQGKNVLLFSHGHFLRVLGARWIGLPTKDARLLGLSVGSISVLSWERNQKIIQSWNCTNHQK